MPTFNNWAVIYAGLGEEDPQTDRAVIEAGGLRTTFVAVPDEDAAVAVAVELVDAGAQTLELCGGFSARVLPNVVEATGGRVPVGQVRYGMEAIPGLAALFAPQTA
jgi:Family of unknown function (DUF6506)